MKGNIPGGRTFNPVTGVNILSSYAAFPEPILLPDGRTTNIISNEDIFKMLLGENYLSVLLFLNANTRASEVRGNAAI